MTAPRHRIQIVRRDGTRATLLSWPPVDRGGADADTDEVVDSFDWERQYRVVGMVGLDPLSHLIDVDNGHEVMRIERAVKQQEIGEWLVYASWTGRYDTAGLGGPWVWGATENTWTWGGADNTWDWSVPAPP